MWWQVITQLISTYILKSKTVKGKVSLPPPPSPQSSIGDVSTLRTKLQARRATLNEEIEKEDKFHQGSKRLLRASIDHKTRDQAMLEANFAESKIKALQSELAKINSSLQAYQKEKWDNHITLVFVTISFSDH